MTHNDITGEALITKPANPAYRAGWDTIFGKKEVVSVDTPIAITEATKDTAI